MIQNPNTIKRVVFRGLFLAVTLVLAFGEETKIAAVAAPSMGAAVFRMIGSLALVIALFFGGAWVFRNMHRFKGASASHRKLQVLEGKNLGPRQAVYVVGYEQQRLLIGATAQGITLLTHLPDGAPQPEQSGGERIIPVSFGEALLKALGRK